MCTRGAAGGAGAAGSLEADWPDAGDASGCSAVVDNGGGAATPATASSGAGTSRKGDTNGATCGAATKTERGGDMSGGCRWAVRAVAETGRTRGTGGGVPVKLGVGNRAAPSEMVGMRGCTASAGSRTTWGRGGLALGPGLEGLRAGDRWDGESGNRGAALC